MEMYAGLAAPASLPAPPGHTTAMSTQLTTSTATHYVVGRCMRRGDKDVVLSAKEKTKHRH